MSLSLFGTLRVAGLLFMLLYLNQVVWAWRFNAISGGGGIVDLSTLILDKAFLWVIGALLILISLYLQIGFSRLDQLIPNQRPARFFKSLRNVFPLLALVYFILIPVVLLSSSSTVNAEEKSITALFEQQTAIIQALKRSPTVPDANAVLQRYQSTYPVRLAVLPENLPQVSVIADQLANEAASRFSRNKFRIHLENKNKNISFVLNDLMYMLLVLLLWASWPDRKSTRLTPVTL